ncbi:MAG: 7-carboxy-7-deazaguanine synthase QueE [Pirellulaceae bacterium]
MLISEIYLSNQGEGLLTGTPSIFIRTSGCNLRCTFCDTPFTSWTPEGTENKPDAIISQISHFAADHVVITGGEPMLQKSLPDLTMDIKRMGKHITIETAGTLFQPVECDLMSISPKLSNSTPTIERAGRWSQRHDQDRINIDVLKSLTDQFPYQLKFVVASDDDLIEIEDLLEQIGNIRRERVLLMPEGVDIQVLNAREHWLRPLCESRGFQYCPRMHILWYGNKRGT